MKHVRVKKDLAQVAVAVVVATAAEVAVAVVATTVVEDLNINSYRTL
jgi:hypothetical protein